MSQQEALRRVSNVPGKLSQSKFLLPSVVTAQICSNWRLLKEQNPVLPPFKDKNIDHDECQHHPLSSCGEKKRNEKVKMEASIMAAAMLALTVLDVTSSVFPSHFEFFFFFFGIAIWLHASESRR